MVLAQRVTQRQQALSVDVVFIKDQIFLLGVMTPLNLTLLHHMHDRSTSSVSVAVDRFVAMAKARQLDVQVMRTDGEGRVLRSKATIE